VDEDDDDEEPRPTIKFSISLAVLLECLNIFGNATLGSGGSAWNHNRNAEQTSTFRRAAKEDPNEVGGGSGKTTSMRLSYAGSGEPLVLLLEEGGIVTRCELSTYVADELMDLPFHNDSRVQKVIMKVCPLSLNILDELY
jgi:cell cycle checkpoint protein